MTVAEGFILGIGAKVFTPESAYSATTCEKGLIDSVKPFIIISYIVCSNRDRGYQKLRNRSH